MTQKKTLDVRHLSQAEVLQRLYNGSFPLGLGTVHFEPEDMTLEEAQKIINNRLEKARIMAVNNPENYALRIDYCQGRVIKMNLTERESLFIGLYDRDNGPGAAARALGITEEKKP